MNPPNPQELEKFIHRTLRALPDRSAPDALVRRVQAAIAARAARPWWRQSWYHWPVAMRAAFLLVATGAAAALALAGLRGLGGDGAAQVAKQFAPQMTFLANLHSLATGLGDCAALLIRHLPPLWLYSVIAFVVAIYGTCFGLGAAAYRTLWQRR